MLYRSVRNITVSALVNSAFVPEYCADGTRERERERNEKFIRWDRIGIGSGFQARVACLSHVHIPCYAAAFLFLCVVFVSHEFDFAKMRFIC